MIDCNTGGLTLSRVEPLTLPKVAVMVVWPAPAEVAKPAALMVATDVADDVQVTLAVRFGLLPSLKCPVAVNCWVAL